MAITVVMCLTSQNMDPQKSISPQHANVQDSRRHIVHVGYNNEMVQSYTIFSISLSLNSQSALMKPAPAV